MIDTCRRHRMRTFVQGATARRWTTSELEWMKHVYMEGRPAICPVCDSRVEICSIDRIAYLRCPGCLNSNEPRAVRSLRPTVVKAYNPAV